MTKHELKAVDEAWANRIEALITRAERATDKYLLGDKRKRFQAFSKREGRIL
jgi:hypothetical protein